MTSPLAVAGRRGIIRRYLEHLPVAGTTPIVTLDEGDTPLIYSERLSSEVHAEVWLKYEGLNPTGSFKDRGMTVAISKALEEGSKGGRVRVHRQHERVGSGIRGRAGLPVRGPDPGGQRRSGKARAGIGARGARSGDQR